MRRWILWGIWGTALIGALANSVWSLSAFQSPQKASSGFLPLQGALPRFILTDQAGRSFGSSDLRGHVWIADFIFTSCAGQCPQMTAQMAQLEKRLPEKIHFVSFTVDPGRDTPAVLDQYAKGSGADFARWHFLTGDAAQIESLAREGFHLTAMSQAESDPREPITHSTRLVLIDQRGVARGFYDATDTQAVEHLSLDAKHLLETEG